MRELALGRHRAAERREQQHQVRHVHLPRPPLSAPACPKCLALASSARYRRSRVQARHLEAKPCAHHAVAVQVGAEAAAGEAEGRQELQEVLDAHMA